MILVVKLALLSKEKLPFNAMGKGKLSKFKG